MWFALAVMAAVSGVTQAQYTTPEGEKKEPAKSLATIVMVKRGEKWLIRSGENVVIDEKAAGHDFGK